VVGVAYMSNASFQITQNFTADHALAAKAIRLPRGSSSAMDSPYLSLVSLMKGWPSQKLRREVLMVSDGIDRLRGDNTGSPSARFPRLAAAGFPLRPPAQRCRRSAQTRTQRAMSANELASLSTRFTPRVYGGSAGTPGKHSSGNLASPRSLMRLGESTSRSGRKAPSASNPIWTVYRGFSTISITWSSRPYRGEETGSNGFELRRK
jgi:hypothetical protein